MINKFKATFLLALLSLLFTTLSKADNGKDSNTVNNDIKSLPINGKIGRILWPYPLKNDSTTVHNGDEAVNETGAQKESSRKKRFLLWSYPQSPLVDMMLQTTAIHSKPQNANDPFDFLRDSYPLPKGYSKALDEYDYIIVGGGTSGSVLASRLTEDKSKATVLVLEAGKPEMLLTDVPALVQYLQLTDYAWPYTMEHQPGVCLGSDEQRCFLPRGKALGGSSVIDHMLYTRGRPEEWDRIAAEGNYGWSYPEVLQYYMKSERSELKKYKNAPYHGRDGELTVENVPFKTGLAEAFLAAGRNLGHPTIDYNSPDQLGFGHVQTTTNRGHRLSSAKAFLHPHKRRKNLHILTDARVTKVVIEPQTKRAYAVNYIRDGVKYTVRCRREVILAAGPIASPQLLLLSGVGPQEQLETLGIPVFANLQVGRSMYDQISFPGVIFKLNSTNASLLEPKVATLPNLIQWLQYGDGLLTTPGYIEALGYVKTSQSSDTANIPDIELISFGGSINIDGGSAVRKSSKISDKTYHTAFGPLNGLDTWSAVPVLLQPKSKGYLELRDTNPYSHPKIYGNFLTDPKDMATLIEAVKKIIRLGESESFRKYDARLFLPEYPNCRTHAPGSDSYWDCAIRTMVVSTRNPIATCRMGPPSDLYAIVDPELRVYGIEGLRVVDSGVIPRPISAHTTPPSIMIGEKAADMIKRAWINAVR